MTEEEWLEANDPEPMLEFLGKKPRERKLRLFACECCRRIWGLLNHEKCDCVIKIAEQRAEGTITLDESYRQGQKFELFCDEDLAHDLMTQTGYSKDACRIALRAIGLIHGLLDSSLGISIARHASNAIAHKLSPSLADFHYDDQDGFELAAVPFRKEEKSAQAALIRELFGNPFHPVTILPEWRSSTVLSLDQGIYADRAFDRMPILADALQDAGCSNEDILNHCRSATVHTRGCWICDLILSK